VLRVSTVAEWPLKVGAFIRGVLGSFESAAPFLGEQIWLQFSLRS
jgi:hypothetical protein